MKISRKRFQELISLYLDGEASNDELELLSLCIRTNEQMRSIFKLSCRIHTATCKHYGKSAKFGELCGAKPPPELENNPNILGKQLFKLASTVALFAICTISMPVFFKSKNHQTQIHEYAPHQITNPTHTAHQVHSLKYIYKPNTTPQTQHYEQKMTFKFISTKLKIEKFAGIPHALKATNSSPNDTFLEKKSPTKPSKKSYPKAVL